MRVLLHGGRREFLFEGGPMLVAEMVGEGVEVDMMARRSSRCSFRSMYIYICIDLGIDGRLALRLSAACCDLFLHI